MVRVFVSLGIEKIRLTGGEPLLRSGLVEMVGELAKMRTAFLHDGTPAEDGLPLDIALTTNGHLLEGLAAPLKDAGLSRVTVSMDAVDPEIFAAITRVPRSFDKVLAGVRKAQDGGAGAGEGELRSAARLQRWSRLRSLQNFHAARASSSGLLSSCRWRKTAAGSPRPWFAWMSLSIG